MIVPFADNADESNPAVMRIYIPDTMARINKCILNFQLEPFRAYSKAIGGGGASINSTNSGGASIETSSSGGGGIETSSSDGGSTQTSKASAEWNLFEIYVPNAVSEQNDHNHGIPEGTPLMINGGGVVYWCPSGSHSHAFEADHRHDVDIPDHRHDIDIPEHEHSISIPNHQHSFNIPNHTHELEFGVYQGSTAENVIIRVDRQAIPVTAIGADINIIQYLSVDSAGKVQRNTWHTVEIVPDKMTRVVANIFLQIFCQSRGGGDY